MRMWMVSPHIMCRKHLLGEHVEMHMLAGSLRRGRSVQGFIDKNLIDTSLMKCRHDMLVAEMQRRGYKHESPLEIDFDFEHEGWVDVDESYYELASRCEDCRDRIYAARAELHNVTKS